jgi:(4S)-4-hydroxy-5-phosphonooxypentane-2,3-dione isomerase
LSKFAVIATYEIAPDQIEVFLSLLRAHRDRCLKDEPGTLSFEILRPEQSLMLYEVYENEAALQAHRNGPLVARFRDEAAKVERKLSFITCNILG